MAARRVACVGDVFVDLQISGVQSFLLPGDVIEDAAKFTVNQSKLQGSLRGKQSTVTGGGGAGTGNKFVPVAQRACYGCGEIGHELSNCPNLTPEEIKAKKAEKGKGKGGVKKEKK